MAGINAMFNNELGLRLVPPPTANHIWKIFGNRQYATSTYRKWLVHNADIFREALPALSFAPPYRVVVTIVRGKGFTESRDLDNCIKPVLDLLKPAKYSKAREGKPPELVSDGCGLIEDDDVEIVREIIARALPAWDSKSEAELYVKVLPADARTHDRPKPVRARKK